MYDKLLANIEQCHRKKYPWSATLLQIQKIYGVAPQIGLLQIGVRLADAKMGIVYFCHDLPDTDSLVSDPRFESLKFPAIDELTLYAVPPELLWIQDGEHYRKAMVDQRIDSTEFRCVYVCYRSSEAVQESSPYTRFVELHMYKNSNDLTVAARG